MAWRHAYFYRVGPVKSGSTFGESIRSAHARVARADRAGHGALVTQSVADFVRCQNSSGQLRSRSIRAPRAVGWTPPGDGAPGWTTGAMSEHSCDAFPGALPLPHGARPHPSNVCVRSAGARSAHDSVTPAVRLRRQRRTTRRPRLCKVFQKVRREMISCCNPNLPTKDS